MTDEVMTPVTKPEALAAAEIHVLRQISDNLAAQTRQIEKLNDKVDEVRERVIALEQSGFDRRLEALKVTLDKFESTLKADIKILEGRTNALESERDKVVGAATFWTWLSKNLPWLLTAALAAAAAVGLKK